jgi:hypothetical protein
MNHYSPVVGAAQAMTSDNLVTMNSRDCNEIGSDTSFSVSGVIVKAFV